MSGWTYQEGYKCGRRYHPYRRRRRAPRWPLWLLAGLVVAAGAAYAGYQLELRPAAASGAASRTLVIAAGQSAPEVAANLKDAGLIRSRLAFEVYVNLHGLRAKLQVGSYSLSASSSTPAIAEAIAGGLAELKKITIPEGYTIAQITKRAADYGLSAADFTAAVKAAHSQSFLDGRPSGVNLEGYLFPDSYTIAPSTTAADLVNAMLDDFGRKVAPVYDSAFVAEGLTLHQGVTLASIVEREVSIAADRPIVAQIFLKRLNQGMSLGSDVTVQYAADLLGDPFDINIASPYNTRLHIGLPPGPICNPGLDALDAVAHPASTDYLYFLAGKDGKTHFAKTYAEHQKNIQLYLN